MHFEGRMRLVLESIKNKELMTNSKKSIKISEDILFDDTCELVPIDTLIKMREFDRKIEPKYDQESSNSTIENLKISIQKEGIKSPLKIDYYQYDKRVLLVEGNHRLIAAIELGLNEYPCTVFRMKMNIPKNKIKQSLQVIGYEPDQSGYVPANLKPSDVGII